MLGIKDQRYFKTAQHLGAGDRPKAHMEEVLDKRESGVGRDRSLAPAAPLLGGHDGGQLRPQPDGPAEIRRLVGVGMSTVLLAMLVDRIEGAQIADGGAQEVHGVAGEGELGQGVGQVPGHVALGSLGRRERFELLGAGELAVPDEVGDLFEAAGRGQPGHRVATVQKDAGLLVYHRDRRRVGDDPGQAPMGLGRARAHTWPSRASRAL